MNGKDFFSRKAKSDDFHTPYSMTEQLLEVEKFNYNKRFLEAACGDYAISKVIDKYLKYDMSCIDIKYGKNYNFLKFSTSFNYIITNPPFSLWDNFIIQAKKIAKTKFAFLGRLEFLTGISRFENNIYEGLKTVHIFIRKVNLSFFDKEKEFEKIELDIKNEKYKTVREIEEKRKQINKTLHYPKLRADGKYPAGMYHYCWFIFEKGYKKKPIFNYINNQKYILSTKDKRCLTKKD